MNENNITLEENLPPEIQEVLDLITKVQDREATVLERERLDLLLADLKETRPDILRQWELDNLWLSAFQTMDEPATPRPVEQTFINQVLDKWEASAEESAPKGPAPKGPAQITQPSLRLVADELGNNEHHAEQLSENALIMKQATAARRFMWLQMTIAAMLILSISAVLAFMNNEPAKSPKDNGTLANKLNTSNSDTATPQTEPVTIVAVRQVSFEDAWHQTETVKPTDDKSPLSQWLTETSPKLEQNLLVSSSSLLDKGMSAVTNLPSSVGLEAIVDDFIES